MYKESIAHVFYECFLGHNLWLKLSNQDDFKCLSSIKLNEKEIFIWLLYRGQQKKYKYK